MTWTTMNPGDGSMGNITSSATRARNYSTAYSSTLSDAADAKFSLYNSVWKGEGAAPWRLEMSRTIDTIQPIIDAYNGAQTALTNYSNTVEGIKTRATSERNKYYNAQSVIDRGVDWGNPIDSGFKVAEAQWHQVEAANALRGLAGERRAADEALVSALSKALPETWEDLREAFHAAGFDSADDLTSEAIAAAMAALALTVASGSGGGAKYELLAFMEVYGTDPDVMSEFYQQLGGANTVALVDELGDAYGYSNGNDAAALELARRLREGLSIASEGWDEQTAEQFAHEMFTGLPSVDMDRGWLEPGRIAAIGYLFGDSVNSPMGKEFTIAAANELDTWERVNGNGSISYGTPGAMGDPGMGATSLHGADMPHGAQLYMAPQNTYEPDQFWWSNVDMAGEIFETLGLYPNEALDFLTGNDKRVDYWYGERDWKVDGFEGASALWSGAQQADGGPYSYEYDPVVGEKIAQLASDVIWNLVENDSFLTENISELGSASLAAGIAPHLDLIADMMLHRDGWDPTGSGVDMRNPFGSDDPRAVPLLSDDVLAHFLSEVGSHDAGALVIQQTIDAYQTLYLAAGVYDPALLGDGLDRATWLQGALDGSGITGRIEEAARYDAKVDAAVNGVKTLIDLIPIPGASKLLAGAGIVVEGASKWALDKMQSQLISQGKGALVAGLKDSLHQSAQVLAEMEDFRQAQTTLHTLSIAETLSIALGPEVVGPIPEPFPGESAEDFSQRVGQWWGPKAQELADNPALDGYDVDHLISDYLDSRDANSYRAQG